MAEDLPPQRRYHIVDQHNELIRVLHGPGLPDHAAISIARAVRAAAKLAGVRVVEYGCDPLTGADGPNFNLGPAPAGGYIVSRLVYDSDEDRPYRDKPFYEFLAAIREAIEEYDLTKDHDPRHNGVTDHDCVRCHIVACLPPGERPARDRKKTA